MAAVAELGRRFFRGIAPRRPRSHLQFAEEELVLGTGPHKGMKFRTDFMPWTRLLLQVYDLGLWRRYFLSGPAQSGKTTLGFVEPAMYHLFEMRQDVILGAPVVEMSQAAYEERLLPAIEAGRYRMYLPRQGAGSRGGKVLSILFENGARLRFMGAGGSDAQRSSYTAPVVVMTEVDKMDEAGRASEEADPVTQMETRTTAFAQAARIYAECTMSTAHGRIYQEVVEYGTNTSPYFQCPECDRPVPLEREHFHGWQEAPDVKTAQDRARFVCPSCDKPWGEEERWLALRKPVLVSKGQEIDDAGKVKGGVPSTNTFGFRWTALASGLVRMADIAEKEFRAERSGKDSDKKALDQFTWAHPYEGDTLDLARVEISTIIQKVVNHPHRTIPKESIKLSLGIDVGSYVIWWVLVGWKSDAQGHVIDFGGIDVPREHGKRSPVAVLASLNAFREDVINPGWDGRRPDLTLVDSGYEQENVYTFVKKSGQGRYYACKGFGSSSRNGMWRGGAHSNRKRMVGNEWRVAKQAGTGIRLVEVNSDYWKAAVHDGFAAAHGAPGSITLYNAPPNDPRLKIFARQIVAEHRELDPSPNKEEKVRWVLLSKQNHYLDCMAYNRAAADLMGIKVTEPPPPPPAGAATGSIIKRVGKRPIRARY